VYVTVLYIFLYYILTSTNQDKSKVGTKRKGKHYN